MQLSDLIDDVRPDVVQAPDLAILDALQKAAAEFFDVSGGWMQLLDPVVLVSGVQSYDLSVPTGARVARIKLAKLSGSMCELRALTELELFAVNQAATSDTPRYIAITDADDALLVYPAPNAGAAGKTITVMAVMTSTREATELPDTIAERFRLGITAGAKSRLLLSRDRPYTDPKLGSMHEAIYRSAVADAKREGTSGRFARPLSVQMRRTV